MGTVTKAGEGGEQARRIEEQQTGSLKIGGGAEQKDAKAFNHATHL